MVYLLQCDKLHTFLCKKAKKSLIALRFCREQIKVAPKILAPAGLMLVRWTRKAAWKTAAGRVCRRWWPIRANSFWLWRPQLEIQHRMDKSKSRLWDRSSDSLHSFMQQRESGKVRKQNVMCWTLSWLCPTAVRNRSTLAKYQAFSHPAIPWAYPRNRATKLTSMMGRCRHKMLKKRGSWKILWDKSH